MIRRLNRTIRALKLSPLFILLALFPVSCVRHTLVSHKKGRMVYGKPSDKAVTTYVRSSIRATLKQAQANTVAEDQKKKERLESDPELASLYQQVENEPKDPAKRRELGLSLAGKGLYYAAYQALQEVYDPETPDLEMELAWAAIWLEWGDFSQSSRHSRRALELESDNSQGLELYGTVLLFQGDYAEATEVLGRAAEGRPENAVLWSNLGYGLLRTGELVQAKQALLKAVALDSSLQKAQNNLGIVLSGLGEQQDAWDHFRQAASPATAHNNIGVIQLSQGQASEARSSFQKAVSIEPSHVKAQVNLLALKQSSPPAVVVHLPPRSAQQASESARGPISRPPVAAPQQTASPDPVSIRQQEASVTRTPTGVPPVVIQLPSRRPEPPAQAGAPAQRASAVPAERFGEGRLPVAKPQLPVLEEPNGLNSGSKSAETPGPVRTRISGGQEIVPPKVQVPIVSLAAGEVLKPPFSRPAPSPPAAGNTLIGHIRIPHGAAFLGANFDPPATPMPSITALGLVELPPLDLPIVKAAFPNLSEETSRSEWKSWMRSDLPDFLAGSLPLPPWPPLFRKLVGNHDGEFIGPPIEAMAPSGWEAMLWIGLLSCCLTLGLGIARPETSRLNLIMSLLPIYLLALV